MSDIERWERLVKGAAKSTAEVYRQQVEPNRIKGVVRDDEICDCCGQWIGSDAHINHCKG